MNIKQVNIEFTNENIEQNVTILRELNLAKESINNSIKRENV